MDGRASKILHRMKFANSANAFKRSGHQKSVNGATCEPGKDTVGRCQLLVVPRET